MNTIPNNKTRKETGIDTINLDENGNATREHKEQNKSRKVTDIDTLTAVEDGDDAREQQPDDTQRLLDKNFSETDSHLATNLQDKSISQHSDVNVEIEIQNMLKQMATDKLKSVSLH